MSTIDTETPGRGIFPDDLLRTCISCGFCLSACPTYQDTRNEASSPRGRINLMRALEAGTLEEDDVREEFSFCLGCRACEPVCPAGVRYGALLEHARDAVGPARDPKLRGLLLAVGSRRRTRLAGRMMRIGQLLGLHRLAPSKGLRASGKAAPLVGSPADLRMREHVGPEDGAPAALFLGCLGHLMFPGAAHAACGTLATAGYAVTTPREQGCCGALHAHNGDLDGARKLADWTIRSFAGSEGPVVTTAGGCGAFMADYGMLLGTPEAEAFGARVRDYSTLVDGPALLEGGALPAAEAAPIRVAYQDSCHLRNGQKVMLEPRALLAALPGVELVELPSAGRCCGAAGTYALMRPDDSLRFLDAKLDEIRAAGVDVIVSGNPGCLLQFRQGVQRAGLKGVRVLHTAELVAERMQR
jgi:glycolate oxidase iron-sulfur subunit